MYRFVLPATAVDPHLNKVELEKSKDMEPVQGTIDIAIPVDALWSCFAQAQQWPRWNSCMFWVWNRKLILGQRLTWAFQPIKPRYLYKLPGIAKIIELEENHKVTWEVTTLPGFYAQHTYFVEDLGNGRCRFGSWEKATGPTFRLFQKFWLAHFEFVKDRSLAGARTLENLYQAEGHLNFND